VAAKETQPPPQGPSNKVDGEAMTGEEESEEEDDALTSRDWIGFLMAQSGDERGPELSGGDDGDRATMEYANFLSDLFLQEGAAVSLSSFSLSFPPPRPLLSICPVSTMWPIVTQIFTTNPSCRERVPG